MTILAERYSDWFLAYFAPHIHGCNLASWGVPKRDRHLFRRGVQDVLFANIRDCKDVIFYPEIRYKGIKVYPCNWSETATDPLLWCLVMPNAVVAAIGVNGYDEFIERMKREENWQWDIREGGGRAFHVDELEKIEGPPPEGAF